RVRPQGRERDALSRQPGAGERRDLQHVARVRELEQSRILEVGPVGEHLETACERGVDALHATGTIERYLQFHGHGNRRSEERCDPQRCDPDAHTSLLEGASCGGAARTLRRAVYTSPATV